MSSSDQVCLTLENKPNYGLENEETEKGRKKSNFLEDVGIFLFVSSSFGLPL